MSDDRRRRILQVLRNEHRRNRLIRRMLRDHTPAEKIDAVLRAYDTVHPR